MDVAMRVLRIKWLMQSINGKMGRS
jgi:hypothetical protein